MEPLPDELGLKGWDLAWSFGQEADTVRAESEARAKQIANRVRDGTAPISCAVPPTELEGRTTFSPLLELDKHSPTAETSRRLVVERAGRYALVVCLPKLDNAEVYDKTVYKLGSGSKSKFRFRVHVTAKVETASGGEAEAEVALSGPPTVDDSGVESALWVNLEHNMCCSRFVLSPADVPATVAFSFASHTSKFKLRLRAQLLTAALESVPESKESATTQPKSASTATLPVLRTSGKWFVEEKFARRRVLLRGVNCSADCKLPTSPDGSTQLPQTWAQDECRGVSFVGRPFPLCEAKEHFGRLQRWGFNCLRFLVTWEAIEHAGPGIYDTEYLDYITEVVRLAGNYGLYVFIDPHQDVWSRMTGGSGAPAWTLHAAGLDLTQLELCGAAFTMSGHPDPAHFPQMTWPQNYQRFAAAHMFTLFFGGNDFAPNFFVERTPDEGGGEEPIQEYLQRHFIASILEVAKRVAHMEHVIGFDSFNEPSAGFIGKALDVLPEPIIPPGAVLKPFDAMVSATMPRTVPVYNKILVASGKETINPLGRSVWRDGCADVWQAHGVWRPPPEASDTAHASVVAPRENGPEARSPSHAFVGLRIKSDSIVSDASTCSDSSGRPKSPDSPIPFEVGGTLDSAMAAEERRIQEENERERGVDTERESTNLSDLGATRGSSPSDASSEASGRKSRNWSFSSSGSDRARRAKPELLIPNYFTKHPVTGRDVSFFRDYVRPFAARYILAMREVVPRAILFVEGDAFGESELNWSQQDPGNVVNATHWYDGFTLFMRRFSSSWTFDTKRNLPVVGKDSIRAVHKRDLSAVASLPRWIEDGGPATMPTLIGEFGIPYNMNNGDAFQSGDYSKHSSALDMYYNVFDELMLHSTQWNYCPSNSNEWGDNWNREDLSIYSEDQKVPGVDASVDPDNGGRAMDGFIRPFAQCTCGAPIETRFNRKSGDFVFSYVPSPHNYGRGDPSVATVIYLPNMQYSVGSSGDQRSSRSPTDSGARPRSPSHRPQGAFLSMKVMVYGGVYELSRLPGRHVLRVWAAMDTNAELIEGDRCVGANPIRVEVKRGPLHATMRRGSM